MVEKLLRAAYLRAVQKWHPDRWPEKDRAQAAERFKRVAWAYGQLRAALPKSPRASTG